LDHIAAAMTLDHIATVILDTIVAFDAVMNILVILVMAAVRGSQIVSQHYV
jgi:hypothetical protein